MLPSTPPERLIRSIALRRAVQAIRYSARTGFPSHELTLGEPEDSLVAEQMRHIADELEPSSIVEAGCPLPSQAHEFGVALLPQCDVSGR